MARMKTISSIKAELVQAEANLEKAQKRVDVLSEKVLSLQKQIQDYEAKQIMEAYKKSGKTFEELMTFFNI